MAARSVYKIAVENRATGDKDPWLWNVTASNPGAALLLSNAMLRRLGWPKDWTSVRADKIADAK